MISFVGFRPGFFSMTFVFVFTVRSLEIDFYMYCFWTTSFWSNSPNLTVFGHLLTTDNFWDSRPCWCYRHWISLSQQIYLFRSSSFNHECFCYSQTLLAVELPVEQATFPRKATPRFASIQDVILVFSFHNIRTAGYRYSNKLLLSHYWGYTLSSHWL